MTKGRVTLPFGGMVVTTTAQTLFIPDETCRRQVTLLGVRRRQDTIAVISDAIHVLSPYFAAGVSKGGIGRHATKAKSPEVYLPKRSRGFENSLPRTKSPGLARTKRSLLSPSTKMSHLTRRGLTHCKFGPRAIKVTYGTPPQVSNTRPRSLLLLCRSS
jgi:hypothetical protein